MICTVETLEALLAETTPGPWRADWRVGHDGHLDGTAHIRAAEGYVAHPEARMQIADAEFCEAAHESLPAIIAEVRALRAEVERLRGTP